MSAKLLELLQSPEARQTKSDHLIANYIERNLAEMPFETAKSIAEGVGVSQMTVGRYLRRLGYEGLEDLKREMRKGAARTAWQVSGQWDRLQDDARDGRLLAGLIQQQIDDLGAIYNITLSAEWKQAVHELATAEEVYVAAWQNVRGVAQYFANQISYARPGVAFADGLNGTYSEILDGRCKNRCLVLMDVRRFASKARLLAEEAARSGVKVILVTDDSCIWAREIEATALIMPGAKGPLWDGAATSVALLDLLVANLVVEMGNSINARVDRLTELQDLFGDFEKE
ncbi:RpiR family transcriptional regulator [Maritalea mobilis]|uniref:RpiR family transcriptional regulator n=1 Tax=Maritalea mobilis TaxID=483324 RepID=A0A4R6VT29_9HYPH|nr:MurR/RpiR family transcriptional regulator [Maritalea mobilis]TDQ67233.1 RpiR family transcriptional regulator [Maritalea mobilis]